MKDESVDIRLGDNRKRVKDTTKKPYSGIAHLTFENGDAIGTGFLTKLDKETFFVTAAHCLWDKEHSAFFDAVLICPGEGDNKRPFKKIKKEAWHFRVPKKYKENCEQLYDYGIIILFEKEIKRLGKCCVFGIEEQTQKMKFGSLYMSGYPGRDCIQRENELTTVTFTEKQLFYRDATTGGNSGSPVYAKRKGRYVALAVHTHGFHEPKSFTESFTGTNSAVRIDVEALMQLVNRKKLRKKLQGTGMTTSDNESFECEGVLNGSDDKNRRRDPPQERALEYWSTEDNQTEFVAAFMLLAMLKHSETYSVTSSDVTRNNVLEDACHPLRCFS